MGKRKVTILGEGLPETSKKFVEAAFQGRGGSILGNMSGFVQE